MTTVAYTETTRLMIWGPGDTYVVVPEHQVFLPAGTRVRVTVEVIEEGDEL
jgi:hypothetical protein